MEIISGKIEKAQKIVIYGPEGIGKSTFASHFPDPLFIDTEGGTNFLDVKRFSSIKDYDDLFEAVTYVGKNPDICKTLVIDTMDWAEEMISLKVMKDNRWKSIETPGYGKGYAVLAEYAQFFLKVLSKLTDLGVNVLLVCHAMPRKFELPGEAGTFDRWELKLQKKVSPLVKEWSDALLFINYKTKITHKDQSDKGVAVGGERVLYTTHRPAFDAKNRWGLEDEVPFSFKSIQAHIPGSEIIEGEKKEEKKEEE